jgi:hypothetical protein
MDQRLYVRDGRRHCFRRVCSEDPSMQVRIGVAGGEHDLTDSLEPKGCGIQVV